MTSFTDRFLNVWRCRRTSTKPNNLLLPL